MESDVRDYRKMYIKKLTAYIGACVCYYIGHIFSEFVYWDYTCNKFTFNGYQNFMNYSSKIQEWGKIDYPWKDIN